MEITKMVGIYIYSIYIYREIFQPIGIYTFYQDIKSIAMENGWFTYYNSITLWSANITMERSTHFQWVNPLFQKLC